MTHSAHLRIAGVTVPPFATDPGIACREKGVDPEIFFPADRHEERASDAKAVCRRCPLRDQCLRWALKHQLSHGVWGGKTGPERQAILKTEEQA